MQQLQYIIETAQQYLDGRMIFDEPIKVQYSSSQQIVDVHGIWSGPTGLYLLEGSGKWDGPLLPEQQNGSLIIDSIYQSLAKQDKPSVVLANYDVDINAIIFQ